MQHGSNLIFVQESKRETEDAPYMNDHQSKDLSIETNSSNHNKGTETGISANDNHGSLKCATDNGN